MQKVLVFAVFSRLLCGKFPFWLLASLYESGLSKIGEVSIRENATHSSCRYTEVGNWKTRLERSNRVRWFSRRTVLNCFFAGHIYTEELLSISEDSDSFLWPQNRLLPLPQVEEMYVALRTTSRCALTRFNRGYCGLRLSQLLCFLSLVILLP